MELQSSEGPPSSREGGSSGKRPQRSWLSPGLAFGLLAAAVLVACSSNPGKPPEGPPPEYERPPVAAWDAGPRAEDPLSDAFDDDGEYEPDDEYDDPPTGGSRAPAPAASDGGPPSSDAQASPTDAGGSSSADSG